MLQQKLPFLSLFPALLIVFGPAVRDLRTKEPAVHSMEANPASPEMCQAVRFTTTGVVCETIYGFTARLDFPQVDVGSVLAGREYLPDEEVVITVAETTQGLATYRSLEFSLHWEPVTPQFLQMHIHEYLPHWKNRIPYRLLWSARYEECALQNCAAWQSVHKSGEILPADVDHLPPGLAADSNFNGVPAAFWNVNLVYQER